MTIAILTVAGLQRRLAGADPACLVVDARTREEFERGHIPGALWLGWEEWCEPAPPEGGQLLAQEGCWGVLADPPAIAHRLAARGVRAGRPLVVYADGARSKGREGRIAWMLLYLGAREVYLLDRGWRGWRDAGGSVETGWQRPGPGHFVAAVNEARRARFHHLKAAYQQGTPSRFVDARCQAEFDGDQHTYMPRMGRLPSAVLIAFDSLFGERESYITPERYRALLPAEAREGQALVTYCEVGVRASLVALLHETHTGQIVAVFDGSLMQWSLDPELPVYGRRTPQGW